MEVHKPQVSDTRIGLIMNIDSRRLLSCFDYVRLAFEIFIHLYKQMFVV